MWILSVKVMDWEYRFLISSFRFLQHLNRLSPLQALSLLPPKGSLHVSQRMVCLLTLNYSFVPICSLITDVRLLQVYVNCRKNPATLEEAVKIGFIQPGGGKATSSFLLCKTTKWESVKTNYSPRDTRSTGEKEREDFFGHPIKGKKKV